MSPYRGESDHGVYSERLGCPVSNLQHQKPSHPTAPYDKQQLNRAHNRQRLNQACNLKRAIDHHRQQHLRLEQHPVCRLPVSDQCALLCVLQLHLEDFQSCYEGDITYILQFFCISFSTNFVHFK